MKNYREVKLDINVNASKEKVWDLLFNRFGEVNVFNPLIEGSHHTSGAQGEVGCERQCDLDANNSIHEKIVAARGNESFDVDIIKGGLPMMDKMLATFDLNALSDEKTKVSFTVKFISKPAFMGGFMKGMMAKMLHKMLVGLKYHLETHGFVTKENIKVILKDYKKMTADSSFNNQQKVSLAA